jgi:ADP-ribosylglycohydrolase
MDASRILDFFLQTGHVPVDRGSIFDSRLDEEIATDFRDIRGMMLGLAIGDALGAPTEGTLPDRRRSEYGDVRDYQPNRANGQRTGLPTDDSQMAFWTLEQLLEDDGFVADNLAQRFCEDEIYGIGGAVREFIHEYKDESNAWFVAGSRSAGNGALMRVPPMIVPHVGTPGVLWAETALSGMITHNDSASIAACVAYVRILWELLQRDRTPDPEWWVNCYTSVARELETDGSHEPRDPSGSIRFRGPIWRFVDEHVLTSYRQDRTTLEVSNYWHSGAYLLETVPTVLYILMRHGDDPEEAIVRAVTDTKDNDTIGAIVGAAVGALHGVDALPKRWRRGLTGRTRADDDDRMFELLAQADQRWNG